MDGRVKGSLERKSVKRKVDERGVMSVSPEYARFLSHNGLDSLSTKVMSCGDAFGRVGCVENGAHRGVVPLMCRERGCPCDDWVQVRSQVDDMKFFLARLFEAVGQPLYVWMLDFTMGSDLWEKVPRTNLGRLRQIAFESMQEYFDHRWKFPVSFPFDAVAQFWHSAEAGNGYDPHVHSIVPRIFVEKSSGRVLTNVKMKFIDEGVMKKIWRRRVQAEYGKSRARVAGTVEKFSCKVNYTEGLGRPNKNHGLDKRMRYMYRGIARDYEVNVMSGVDYSKWDKDWVRWTLRHNHKRHQGYGLLSARNVSPKSGFMRALKLDLGTKREREHVRRHGVCPHCGGERIPVHNEDSDLKPLTRKEAFDAGLEVWRSSYDDEERKFRDFVPYHS